MAQREQRVIVVGGGFGGLKAAKTLSRAGVKVVLLDGNNYHLFQPLLYQVATAGLEPEQIAKPIRSVLAREKNVEFLMAKAKGVNLRDHLVETTEGELPYDHLILAVGAETWIPEVPSLKNHSLVMKSLMDAIRIRNHILRSFEKANSRSSEEERKALLTFSVAGAGPTGVEMAGALAELVGAVQGRDYPQLDSRYFRVILLEKAPSVLPGFPEGLRDAASRILQRKGVELKLGKGVVGFQGDEVELEDGEVIVSKTLIWCAGVRGSNLLGQLGIPLSKDGRIVVEPTLQIPGHPEVYVIGDAAYLEIDGHPLPMMAPAAIQMGESAAKNILRNMKGEASLPFHYRDAGLLATIGGNAAVAKVYGLELKGFSAWFVWLLVHILAIIGFRNKLMVLINWAWDYLFHEREDRIIVNPQN